MIFSKEKLIIHNIIYSLLNSHLKHFSIFPKTERDKGTLYTYLLLTTEGRILIADLVDIIKSNPIIPSYVIEQIKLADTR